MHPTAPKKSRFADNTPTQANVTGKLSIGAVKVYNDDVVQAVTFAYLIDSTDEFIVCVYSVLIAIKS